MKDRSRGALIGLAVGDALGAAVEFKSPGNFAPVTGYRNGGPHRLEAGEWTDDTSMALALADSIATALPFRDKKRAWKPLQELNDIKTNQPECCVHSLLQMN